MMQFGEGGEQEFEGRRHHRRGHAGKGERRGRGHHRGGRGGEFGKYMFDRMDADNDGAVTLEEALASAPAKMAREGRKRHRRGRGGPGMMRHMDTNGDGAITSTELDNWQKSKRQRILDRMDFNGDGQIDKSDRDGKITQRFKKFDADKDGKVTREEVRLVMADWRAERRAAMRKLRQDFWGSSAD